MTEQDTARNQRKEKRERDSAPTAFQPDTDLAWVIDTPPAASVSDPAPSWDSGFGGGDTGGGGGGGDF
jgi:hypothetical protein